MKKIIISTITIFLSVLNAFGENGNDTTIVYNGMDIHLSVNESSINVNVTKSNSTVYSAVYEQKSDSVSAKTTHRLIEDIPLLNLLSRDNNKKHTTFRPHLSSLAVGFNKPMKTENDCPDNNVARSTNITLIPFDHGFAINKYLGLAVGFGFEWENYRLTDDEFFKYENGILETRNVKEIGPNATVEESKMRTFGFVFPIMLELNQGNFNSLFCSAGIVLNINPGSHYYSKISVDDEIMKFKCDDLHHNVFGYDFMAQVGYKKMGLFARYSMTEVFKSNHGPKMNALTFGMNWFFR